MNDDALLQKLWTKAVGTEGYVKSEWKALAKQLARGEPVGDNKCEHCPHPLHGRDACGFSGHPSWSCGCTGEKYTPAAPPPLALPERRRLPDTRQSVTRKFALPGLEPGERWKMYATAGLYEDGKPGEFFIRADRAGSHAGGLLDGLAIAISLGLQYGVPVGAFARQFQATKFPPAGLTGDPEYPIAQSPLDYLAAWMRKLGGGEMKLKGKDEKREGEGG